MSIHIKAHTYSIVHVYNIHVHVQHMYVHVQYMCITIVVQCTNIHVIYDFGPAEYYLFFNANNIANEGYVYIPVTFNLVIL